MAHSAPFHHSHRLPGPGGARFAAHGRGRKVDTQVARDGLAVDGASKKNLARSQGHLILQRSSIASCKPTHGVEGARLQPLQLSFLASLGMTDAPRRSAKT